MRSLGRPLTATARAFFEPRFGHDFSDVRIHTDPLAARSAKVLAAQAYTVGSDVVFGTGRYAPESREGQRLLAHELAHVVQQRSAGANPSLRRFHLPHGTHKVDETPLIAPTFEDMLATIKVLIKASTSGDTVAMDPFVQNAGGLPFTKQLDKKLGTKSTPTVKSKLNYRYLFTCRCGLIDLRHFLQLMYISNFAASAAPGVDASHIATTQGREHELTSEAESRFGPEDTPSNALGAFTGTRLAVYPRPDDLFDTIKDTLTRCSPTDFASLSAASQDTIKHHYGDLTPDSTPKKPGDLIPKNQNQTAVPDILGIKECGGERSFPFSLDTDDADKKTLSHTAFDKGSSSLESDSDIRDFVATQRPQILQGLSSAEKVRLVKRLFSGYVSDEDIDTIETLYQSSSATEKAQIKSSVDSNELWSVGQRTRLRVLFS